MIQFAERTRRTNDTEIEKSAERDERTNERDETAERDERTTINLTESYGAPLPSTQLSLSIFRDFTTDYSCLHDANAIWAKLILDLVSLVG